MNRDRVAPNGMRPPHHGGSVPGCRPRLAFLAHGFAMMALLSLTGIASAQSQSTPPPPSQPQKPAANSPDPAPEAHSKGDEPAGPKVYTNRDLAALPPTAISIPGPPPPKVAAASPKSSPEDEDAKAAAYWRARFTAARQKLAQDKPALADLQQQLELQRVQETGVDECTGQVYSDEFMDLLGRIDAMKKTIKSDQQALSDLHEEFRRAGGEPGWIR